MNVPEFPGKGFTNSSPCLLAGEESWVPVLVNVLEAKLSDNVTSGRTLARTQPTKPLDKFDTRDYIDNYGLNWTLSWYQFTLALGVGLLLRIPRGFSYRPLPIVSHFVVIWIGLCNLRTAHQIRVWDNRHEMEEGESDNTWLAVPSKSSSIYK